MCNNLIFIAKKLKMLSSNENKSSDPFSSIEKPSIDIEDYIYKLHSCLGAEDSTYIIAGIYIDRFLLKSNYYLNPLNVHRIALLSIFFAMKYNEDYYPRQKIFAMCAGIHCRELLLLEHIYAIIIEHDFFVKKELYDKNVIVVQNDIKKLN